MYRSRLRKSVRYIVHWYQPMGGYTDTWHSLARGRVKNRVLFARLATILHNGYSQYW